MDEFKCSNCATCCKNIRGFLTEKQKKELRKYSFGALPMVSLIPVERIAFPLWDFEAKKLIKDATEKGIEHKIRPSRAIFDLDSNQAIIVSYSIDSDFCTFMKGNQCQSYEKRGFVCKMFPFQHGPFLKLEEFAINEMFAGCPSMANILDNLEKFDKKKLTMQLKEKFGDSFLSVLQSDLITQWINNMILTLVKEKKIRPAMNYPYDLLLKRIDNSKKIDFMDFLVEIKEMTKEDKDNLIHCFETNHHAKEKVKDDLS
ncbi:MAG: YkgJ family cysteine cluster protein [Nanoarchaeota archaeon]|nr:YkgJ family cysteine cluster protein [Nanoarchaeota archaeon]MBU1703765.1 YkgJ family cysteine cluster protein [Nanoarchaeota archaeon]